MEDKRFRVGELAKLPNGELVRIEIIYDDGEARVRRVEGEREGGLIPVCALRKLEDVTEQDHHRTARS